MKALILSDIHSNIHALEAIWAVEKDSDLVYCTGDLVDYGPYPKEVLDWVRAHNVQCTQGNHDAWLVYNAPNGATRSNDPAPPEEERYWVHHNLALLTPDDIAFLEGLPQSRHFTLDGIPYGMTHLYEEYKEIVSLHAYEQHRQARFPEAETPPRLILGHTHRQAIRILADDRLWLNPGSASYRRKDDPDQTAHYITITDGTIRLHRRPYDITPVWEAVRGVTLHPDEIQTIRHFFGPR